MSLESGRWSNMSVRAPPSVRVAHAAPPSISEQPTAKSKPVEPAQSHKEAGIGSWIEVNKHDQDKSDASSEDGSIRTKLHVAEKEPLLVPMDEYLAAHPNEAVDKAKDVDMEETDD
jgi:hypothetical protein